MRAVVVEKLGGPEVLSVIECPEPEPQAGQVLVQVAAAGVNFMDIYTRQGVGGYKPAQFPVVLGAEGAGTVTAVGPGVTGVSVGDRVAWAGAPGCYATHAAIPASRTVPVPQRGRPAGRGGGDAPGHDRALPVLQYLPGARGGRRRVHAAAGGVGLLLTQMIKRRGGIVIATTSGGAGGEKAALARQAGADHVAGYEQFRATVADVTAGRGCDVVYDGVGQATFDDGLAALHPRGMMVLYGAASGQVPPLDPQLLNYGGSLFLTRPTLVHYIADRHELLWRAGDLFGWMAEGVLDVRIGGTYPLADAARAHEDLAARRTTGKLLLLP